MNWNLIIPSVLSVIGSVGVTRVFLIPAQKRIMRAQSSSSEADAEVKLSQQSMEILKPAREEVGRLSARLTETDSKLTEANKLIDRLTADLRTAQAELSELRSQVDRATKDHAAAIEEIHRLQGNDARG